MISSVTFEKVSKSYRITKGKYGLLRDVISESLFGFFKRNTSSDDLVKAVGDLENALE